MKWNRTYVGIQLMNYNYIYNPKIKPVVIITVYQKAGVSCMQRTPALTMCIFVCLNIGSCLNLMILLHWLIDTNY